VNAWLYIGLALLAVLGVVFWPVLTALRRNVRMIQNGQTPEARLQIPNLWTEIEQSKGAGSFQMMRMKDGNIIFLSVGADTAKVFVTPRLDSPDSFTEYASFPIQKRTSSTREQESITLNELRSAIGWPSSASELRQKLKNQWQA
jgi:hypothetical protein